VLASDNRPARIQVGSEEPIATGSIQQAVGGVAQSTTIQYRNTGRILTIIPQVNSQGLVNLQIKAEVSARGDDVTVGQDKYPAFNTQDAETTAVVNDGETLVIGGLIGELKRKGRVGVPYLMDIPVIGRFFGTTSDESTRTELIMLITPRVIRNRTDSRLVTADFKAGLEKVRDELERIAKDRARLLPPRPLPPLPDPNQYYQYDQQEEPAPTDPPVGPRSSLPPVVENVTVLSNDPITRRMMPPMAVPQEPIPVSLAQTQPAATQSYNQPIQSAAPALPAPPAYILSFASAPPVAAPPPPAVSVSPAQRQMPADARRIWTVQVAAVSEMNAAESLAQKLRRLGYDAYVRVIQSDNKTWHRVRVGQLENQKDAADLRNILSTTKEHKNAYIALY
jgi:cell division septation protein DedD